MKNETRRSECGFYVKYLGLSNAVSLSELVIKAAKKP